MVMTADSFKKVIGMSDASALDFHRLVAIFSSFVVPLKSIAVVSLMLAQAMRKTYKKVDGRIYVSWWESGQIENKQEATHCGLLCCCFSCFHSACYSVRLFLKFLHTYIHQK